MPVAIDLLAELPVARKQAESFSGPATVVIKCRKVMTHFELQHDLWTAWWKSLDGKQLLEGFSLRRSSSDERDKVLGLIKK